LPDHYLFSDSDIPGPGELNLPSLDEDSLGAILNLELPELVDFYYAEVQKDIDGVTELIEEEKADVLYGVSKRFYLLSPHYC
jgi:hypothetical protein